MRPDAPGVGRTGPVVVLTEPRRSRFPDVNDRAVTCPARRLPYPDDIRLLHMNGESAPSGSVPESSGHGSSPAALRPPPRPARAHRPAPEELLRTLVGEHPERLVHVHEVPAREAVHAAWPEWVDPTLLGAL